MGRVPAVVATVALVIVVFNTSIEVLPSDPLVSVLTPLRLVVLTGLVALVVSGVRMADVRSPLDYPVGLLLMVAVGVTVLGNHWLAPVRGLMTGVGVFVLTAGVLRRLPGAREALLFTMLLAALVSASIGLAQVAQGSQTGFSRVGFERATGTFANPNILAAYLLLIAPFAVVAILSNLRLAEGSSEVSDGDRTAVALVVLGVLALGLLVTGSRTGLVAAVASCMALVLVRRAVGRRAPPSPPTVSRVFGRHRRDGASTAMTLPIMPVFGFGGLLALAAILMARVSGRDEVWALALQVGSQHPMAGVGLGRVQTALTAINPGRIEKVYYHAHNLWLNWFVEAGVPGLIAITAVTVTAVVLAVRTAATGTPLGAATLASVIGFLVVCLADHPNAIDRVETTWWVVLGVAAAVQVPKDLTGAARARPACDDEYVGSIGPAIPPSARRAPAQVPIATT